MNRDSILTHPCEDARNTICVITGAMSFLLAVKKSMERTDPGVRHRSEQRITPEVKILAYD